MEAVSDLLTFAKQEFKHQGIREKLESVWRQTGIKPAELDDLVECPEDLVYLWVYFIRLHNQRQAGGMSVNPLSFSDIDSFFRLEQVVPMPGEVEIICRLDSIAMQAYSEQSKAESKKNSKK